MRINRRGRKALVLIVVVALVAAGMVWLRSFAFSTVAANLNERIDSLKVSGFIITYDTLLVNWRKNTIEARQVVVEKNAYDTTCTYPEFVKIGKVRAQGLRIIPLLFENILSFETLYLENSHVVMRPNSLFRLDSTARKKNQFTFSADNISMKSVHLEYLDSAACESILGLKSNLVLQGLKLNFNAGQPLAWKMATLTFDSLQLRMHRKPSTYEVLRAKVDFTKKMLDIDTIRLIPDYARLEYGRKFGYEVDRMEGVIPFVRVTGFNLTDSSVVSARLAEMQVYLKIFRDKRLPFRKEIKLLPTTQLRDLPFDLHIDTVKLIKASSNTRNWKMMRQRQVRSISTICKPLSQTSSVEPGKEKSNSRPAHSCSVKEK